MERHQKGHENNGCYRCRDCTFSCDTPQALTVHITRHHNDEQDGGDCADDQEDEIYFKQEDVVVEPDMSEVFAPKGIELTSYDAALNMYYASGLQPNVIYTYYY